MSYKPIAFKGTEAQRRWKMCCSKKTYHSPEEARDNGCKVYPCPYCGWWHRATLKKPRV